MGGVWSGSVATLMCWSVRGISASSGDGRGIWSRMLHTVETRTVWRGAGRPSSLTSTHHCRSSGFQDGVVCSDASGHHRAVALDVLASIGKACRMTAIRPQRVVTAIALVLALSFGTIIATSSSTPEAAAAKRVTKSYVLKDCVIKALPNRPGLQGHGCDLFSTPRVVSYATAAQVKKTNDAILTAARRCVLGGGVALLLAKAFGGAVGWAVFAADCVKSVVVQ